MNTRTLIGAINAGFTIFAQRPRTAHPGDSHLFIVLGVKDHPMGKKFVTWNFNASDDGYGSGHYFHEHPEDQGDDAYKIALKDFCER